jgi:glutamate formiminotransferase/formiminotetrahydrofolate cyclodeaminase
MNLVNTEATPIHRVLALVREEAARRGAMISGCEVVGLIPSSAMFDAAEHSLQLEDFRRDQVLELRLKQPPLTEAVTLHAVLEQVAGPTPTPGGGTVAAIAGALAGALATMVANLTIGKKKYAAADSEMRGIKDKADTLRRELMSLARADAEAFEAVLRAGRLPQGTKEQAEIRETAMAKSNLDAARVPLRTAEACLEVLGLAERAARSGNPNAVTDAGVAGLLARAAGEGALLNVEINLKSAASTADKEDVETGLHRLRAAIDAAARDHQTAVRSVLDES